MADRQETTSEIPEEEVRRQRASDAERFQEDREVTVNDDLVLEEELEVEQRAFFSGLSPHEIPYEEGDSSKVPGVILTLKGLGADSELVDELQAHGLGEELVDLPNGFPGQEFKFPNAIFRVKEGQVLIFFPDRSKEVARGFRLDQGAVRAVQAYNGRVIWKGM